MEFCPPNITLTDVWLNDGWSHCFLDTVSASIVASFLLVFGTIQLVVYKKYAIANDDVRPSRGFQLQIVLHVFVPILALTRLMLQATAYNAAHTIYGYMVVEFGGTLVAYLMIVALLAKERYYLLPSTPSHGHGLVLLVAWTLQFIVENLALMNMRSLEWEDLASRRNAIELVLFGCRYVACLFVFGLGLKAPGIARPANDSYDRLSVNGNDVSALAKSVLLIGNYIDHSRSIGYHKKYH